MRETLRELAGSILFAIVAIGLVLGGISLALAEGFIPVESNPFPSPTPFALPGSATSTPMFVIQTLPPETPSATLPPVQTTQVSTIPSPTTTLRPCGPPGGWVVYTVRAGDTLFSLSQAYGVTVAQLQGANCMPAGTTSLSTGQKLWVPNVVTRTPLASRTPTLTPVSIVFPTLTVSLTTGAPTQPPTSTGTPTQTYTPPPSATQPPTSTSPPTATATITSFP